MNINNSILNRLTMAERIREAIIFSGENGSGGGVPNIISTFTVSQTTAEVGEIIADLTLNWTYSPNVDPDTSQTINQGVGVIANNLRTANTGAVDTTVGASKIWTLTTVDQTITYNKQSTISFQRKRYWGVSTDPNIGLAPFAVGDIPTFSSEFATTRNTSKTFNCTGGRYIYMIYPASFGTNTPEWELNNFPIVLTNVRTVNFTNASGNTTSYIIQRSDNLLNGSSIPIEVL